MWAAKARNADRFVEGGGEDCVDIKPRKPKIGEDLKDRTPLFGLFVFEVNSF